MGLIFQILPIFFFFFLNFLSPVPPFFLSIRSSTIILIFIFSSRQDCRTRRYSKKKKSKVGMKWIRFTNYRFSFRPFAGRQPRSAYIQYICKYPYIHNMQRDRVVLCSRSSVRSFVRPFVR